MLKDRPAATRALEAAFALDKGSTYLALSLAGIYEHDGKIDAAKDVLTAAVKENPDDKDIRYQIAMFLLRHQDDSKPQILHHLHSSFIKGDTRYEAQFAYARMLYLTGNIEGARAIFSSLRDAVVDAGLKRAVRGHVFELGEPARFTGVVLRKEHSYSFIKRDGVGDEVFAHRKEYGGIFWKKSRYQQRVSFYLAFNYLGPLATAVTPEGKRAHKKPKNDAGRIGRSASV